MARAKRLNLDWSVRIVPGNDMLHIVQRHGAFDLHGKDLIKLHERLLPYLDGRFTRAELLSSAGDRAPMVDRYLEGLQRAGALSGGAGQTTLPPSFPVPRRGRQELKVGRRHVAVTLAGPAGASTAALEVCFVARRELDRLLLGLEALGRRRDHIWIVSDREADDHELARRAAVSRYLIGLELGRDGHERLGIYELAPYRTAIRRLALIERPAAPQSSLPHQLGLIRLEEHPQLPLVSMVAELPGLDRRMKAFGLDARETHAALSVEFLAREALLEAARRDRLLGEQESAGGKTVGATVPIKQAQAADAVVDTSYAGCLKKLLFRWALEQPGGDCRRIDLLALKPPSGRVAVLQNLVRRRRRRLVASMSDRLQPLVVVRSDPIAAAGLDAEQALAEVLLQIAAEDVGIDAANALACAPSRLRQSTVRRRLKVALLRGGRLPLIRGRFRGWGATRFFAIPTDL